MTNIQLYTKISRLPTNLQYEVNDFIEFLKFKSRKNNGNKTKRVAGMAKGLIKMHNNFDDPIEGFKEYLP
jgi:hypothetical protein